MYLPFLKVSIGMKETGKLLANREIRAKKLKIFKNFKDFVEAKPEERTRQACYVLE
jgi:hypothetical protein